MVKDSSHEFDDPIDCLAAAISSPSAPFPPDLLHTTIKGPHEVASFVLRNQLHKIDSHGLRLRSCERSKLTSENRMDLPRRSAFAPFDDADLDAAVNGVAFGAFANSGQICMSTVRIVVDHAIADKFVHLLAMKASGTVARRSAHWPVVLEFVVDMAMVHRCRRLT